MIPAPNSYAYYYQTWQPQAQGPSTSSFHTANRRPESPPKPAEKMATKKTAKRSSESPSPPAYTEESLTEDQLLALPKETLVAKIRALEGSDAKEPSKSEKSAGGKVWLKAGRLAVVRLGAAGGKSSNSIDSNATVSHDKHKPKAEQDAPEEAAEQEDTQDSGTDAEGQESVKERVAALRELMYQKIYDSMTGRDTRYSFRVEIPLAATETKVWLRLIRYKLPSFIPGPPPPRLSYTKKDFEKKILRREVVRTLRATARQPAAHLLLYHCDFYRNFKMRWFRDEGVVVITGEYYTF